MDNLGVADLCGDLALNMSLTFLAVWASEKGGPVRCVSGKPPERCIPEID